MTDPSIFQLRRRSPGWSVLVAVAVVGACSLPPAVLPPQRPSGRFAVVFTNHSDSLVNALLVVLTGQDEELTWAVPVAPQSWDSLILDCDVREVTPVGAVVTDPLGIDEPIEIGFDEPPFIGGLDFDCGSIIEVRMENSTRGLPSRPITAHSRTTNRSTRSAETAGFGPAAETGFILMEATAPAGLPVRIHFGWEDGESRVFQSSLTLSGRETQFGALLNCPVQRFTLGQLDEPDTPGATLTGSGDVVDAPPPLPDEPVPCGGTISIRLIESADAASGYALTLERTANAPGETGALYDDIRILLDEEGLYDQPSSLLSLLPPPALSDTR